MKFVAVQFDFPGVEKYDRLLSALQNSIEALGQVLEVIRIHPPRPIAQGKSRSYASNTVKLARWVEAVEATDEDVVLIDCDTVVLQDVSDIFQEDFDICFTKRAEGAAIPLNGGVIFVKNNERSRAWLRELQAVNNRMYVNNAFHQTWRRRYAGINQAAMGYMLVKRQDIATVISVPSYIYNCCDSFDWYRIDEQVKILHIKSQLRVAALMAADGKDIPDDRLEPAVNIWLQFSRNDYDKGTIGQGEAGAASLGSAEDHPVLRLVD